MSEIGGMILAAGLSERMDEPVPKQLLPLGSLSLAALSVRNAEASRLDRVVVVTGHRADEVAATLGGGRAQVVENRHYRAGNMSSFRTGATALAGCDAVVVLLGDQPGVTPAMIDRLIDEWYFHRPWAAWCVYSDRQGHPLLFSAEALRSASVAQGEKGVWRFLTAAGGRVRPIGFTMPAPIDVNTQEDYRRLLAEWSSS